MIKTIMMTAMMCFALLGCGGSDSNNNPVEGPFGSGNQEIEMMFGDQFSPDHVEIKVGDTVRWTNTDEENHTATGSDFDSGTLRPGQSFSHTFTQAGTFNYHCRFHSMMVGEVVVQ